MLRTYRGRGSSLVSKNRRVHQRFSRRNEQGLGDEGTS